MCDPLVIDTGCRPTTIQIRDHQTVITVDHKRAPRRLPLILWLLGPIQEQDLPSHTGVPHMTNMSDSQQVSGTIQPIDKKGQPAPVQPGTSVFTSSDEAVVTVTADPANELGVTVKAVAAGSAQVRWAGDADLGDGVVTITAAEDFTISGGQAVGAGFTFGQPTEQV
jgi:hypothetical protein